MNILSHYSVKAATFLLRSRTLTCLVLIIQDYNDRMFCKNNSSIWRYMCQSFMCVVDEFRVIFIHRVETRLTLMTKLLKDIFNVNNRIDAFRGLVITWIEHRCQRSKSLGVKSNIIVRRETTTHHANGTRSRCILFVIHPNCKINFTHHRPMI
jgi:hypothetical protein